MNDTAALELVESMVRIPSVSTHEAEISAFLVDRMRQAGFAAEVDGAGNAVGAIGRGGCEVVLLGHVDTAPGVVPIRVDDGKLYGRGSVDAKGPLAAFVVAAARVADTLPVRLTVIGCVEEEAPSSKGAHFVVDRVGPDFCIVGEPSGWNGVTLGYKGYLRAKIAIEVATSHSAHGRPTAADVACKLWTSIDYSVARFNEGRVRLFDRLLAALLEITSVNDGCADRATLDIGLRLPPDLGPEAMKRVLAEWAGGHLLTTDGDMPAWSGPRTTPLVRAFTTGIRAHGGEPRWLLKTGTADSNIVAPVWKCPTVAYGPGNAELDHSPHEHLTLDDYLRSISILEHVLRDVAGGAAVGSLGDKTLP